MADGIESDGRSADSALLFDDDEFDPLATSDDPERLSSVWQRCDTLRELLKQQGNPGDADRLELKANLVYQLSTLVLYWQVRVFLRALKDKRAPSKTASLYVLLFPGEAKDNTGNKDLNDKVLGTWWTSEYIQRRFQAIQSVFDDPQSKFMVVAQTYKTAYILTYERTRAEFAKSLVTLDGLLKDALLKTLDDAQNDPHTDKSKHPAIKELRRKLNKKKKYRFDIFFGLRTLKPGKDPLEDVFLLVTEALKGAALARFVAKAKSIKTKPAREFAKGINPDGRKLDARGKEYAWPVYLNVSNRAEKIKALVVGGYTQASPYELYQIYIDTVWTVAFIKRKNLFWGNPDVIRDVRKKKLERAPIKQGNVTYSFPAQKELMETWLVILNMVDFVTRFKSSEFRKQVQVYHDDALEVFVQLGTASSKIDWAKLEQVLTHDARGKKLAIFERASEFLFYSYASDYSERIIFSMDIRDAGVELMLDYETSNRAIGFNKYSDVDLMEETFRASDGIEDRRRVTYEGVVRIFKKYYDLLKKQPAGAKTQAAKAFGISAVEPLSSFEESVQLMVGGDELYAAAHPLFAEHVAAIIGEWDAIKRPPPFDNQPLDMRTVVVFSSAKRDKSNQRTENQLSHQEALKLAAEAPGLLKRLERTNRRIERLIDMLEANDKKKDKAPPYRAELIKLALLKLFARLKYAHGQRLPVADFQALLRAFAAADIKAAQDTKRFELVDFKGNVIDGEKLEKDAAALEQRVRSDVGLDNTRQQPPPVNKMPGWMEDFLDCWEDPKCWPPF